MKKMTVALAGNPNVGKSTVFNALTGLKQHTGNWTGKTVGTAEGTFSGKSAEYRLVDLPGTYSLFASSAEEERARDYIFFGDYDAIIAVADATSLERNLNLLLQLLEFTPKVSVCVNLIDEAQKRGIELDLDELSLRLCTEVTGTSARSKTGLDELIEATKLAANAQKIRRLVTYGEEIERAVSMLLVPCGEAFPQYSPRWLALRLLENEKSFIKALRCESEATDKLVSDASHIKTLLSLDDESVRDGITRALVGKSEEICKACVKCKSRSDEIDRRLDRIFTSKLTGIPVMLALLCGILWLTIEGANLPSRLLSDMFISLEDKAFSSLLKINVPENVTSFLCEGVLRTVGWVVSVMLPPMAIFFPLFTILEDFGYLPRVAFNLDRFFKKSGASGKQSLTMCMGLGCNACGVTGCRIIDSQRERSIAVITNNLVPCNGRFPTLIAIITMFFAQASGGLLDSITGTLIMACFIVGGVAMTLLSSRFLSKTVLKGENSHFALELPPYRKPQIGKVIIRSLADRTVFVLARAICASVPAGALIWILANNGGETSLLCTIADFISPAASFIGLDGVILLAFILGFPANEIVFPIIIMAYTASGSLTEINDLGALRTLLCENGWTNTTAFCTMAFSLFHFPCATTCMTIYKETKSVAQTLLAIALPTVIGIIVCLCTKILFG